MKYTPKYGVWEMTLQCNMNCLHCGSKAGKNRNNELTLEECMDVAQQLIDMGCEKMTFIGGEILTNNFWHKVSRKLVDNGVRTNIITNAYVVGDKQMQQIRESGIELVAVSIDGDEETHNRIRGRKDSFARAKKALKMFKDEGLGTSIITTVMSANINELEKIYDFTVENGIDVWQLQLAAPMGNASENNDLIIQPEQIPYIIEFIKNKNKLGETILIAGDNVGYCTKDEAYIRSYPGEFGMHYGCLAGLLVVGIDSVGNIRGCQSLYDDKFIEGNLKENSLKEIWNRKGAFSYNRDFKPDKLTGNCKGCEKGAVCAGGCRQMSYFTSGELYNNKYCAYRL